MTSHGPRTHGGHSTMTVISYDLKAKAIKNESPVSFTMKIVLCNADRWFP